MIIIPMTGRRWLFLSTNGAWCPRISPFASVFNYKWKEKRVPRSCREVSVRGIYADFASWFRPVWGVREFVIVTFWLFGRLSTPLDAPSGVRDGQGMLQAAPTWLQNPPKSMKNRCQDAFACEYTFLICFSQIWNGFLLPTSTAGTFKIIVFPKEKRSFFRKLIFEDNIDFGSILEAHLVLFGFQNLSKSLKNWFPRTSKNSSI